MHAALLRACAAGDSAALARLYEATAAQLFGLALRIVRRRELAEEVVQDAFVSAWRNAGRYDERRGTQTGSHNLVLGTEQSFTSYSGLVGGGANSITRPYAAVFGAGNKAFGNFSSVTSARAASIPWARQPGPLPVPKFGPWMRRT